ncbi:MAG: nucleotidyltransferase domain-containing protein [Cyanobium sp.]
MPSLSAIREQRHQARLLALRQGLVPILRHRRGATVWLFGSLARGDWDAYSDVDLLAVAPDPAQASALADDLLAAGLADDVLALSTSRWLQLRSGDDPYWRAIGVDAIRLDPL